MFFSNGEIYNYTYSNGNKITKKSIKKTPKWAYYTKDGKCLRACDPDWQQYTNSDKFEVDDNDDFSDMDLPIFDLAA